MENETTLQKSSGIAAWKIITPAIGIMTVVQGLNELTRVKASGYVTTISVTVLALSMIFMSLFCFRADTEMRRLLKTLFCGMGIAVVGILFGKLLGTPICYVAGYLTGFFHGLIIGA
jgi:hypothetical protein